jgi:hypothetical protein
MPYQDYDKNMPQFLATQIEDFFRILYRLQEKNIPKNDKIKKFIEDELQITNVPWLFDSKFINKIVTLFCENLGNKLLDIYKKEYTKTFDIKKSVSVVEKFLNGVSYVRVDIDYNLLTDKGKKLLKLMFSNLIKEIDKKNIINIEMDSKFLKLLKFLVNKLFS